MCGGGVYYENGPGGELVVNLEYGHDGNTRDKCRHSQTIAPHNRSDQLIGCEFQ